MGDTHRTLEFANFIRWNYPKDKYPCICCVADGKLELSRLLHRYGYQIIAYEPNLRKGVNKTFKTNIILKKKWFTRDELIKCNLIVGMHPDEATIEIILAGIKNTIPYAVVPCCIVGDKNYTNKCQNYKAWIKLLKQLHTNTEEYHLDITGKNILLYNKFDKLV